MSFLEKSRRGEAAVFQFASEAAIDSSSLAGASLLFLTIALLAWTAMPLSGVLKSEWAAGFMLLAASASALAISHRRFVSQRAGDEADHEQTSYRNLAASVGGIVAKIGADGRVLEVQANEVLDFGLSATDLLGQGYFEHVHVADRPSFLRALSEAAHGKETTSTVIRLRRNAPFTLRDEPQAPTFARAEVRFRALSASLRNQTGYDVLAVTRSVTDLYELENNLESARREAQLSITIKDRLLANVSHELRTPLNAILGFSEILGDEDLAPTEANKRIEYARIIHSSADHLLSVVNQVLDMSKIEAGKFDLVPESFYLEPLIKDCCDMLRLKAENGQVLMVQASMLEPLELIADKRACRQILLNLLSNAVKFTLPNGSVVVGARREGDEIHLHVSDTGIGIDPDHFPGLGSPFYQVRSSYNRNFEGAGLGLSLVRGLVGLHGGSILLETECGVGTRVTARFPIDCRSSRSNLSNTTKLETIDSIRHSSTMVPTSQASDRGERKFA